MERVAFKMQLYKGFEAEYKKRHDEIWPELSQLLKESGVSEYSIFLDESTNSLFGFLKAEDPNALDGLPTKEIMQRWWKNIRDIMESNPDNSPVSVPFNIEYWLLEEAKLQRMPKPKPLLGCIALVTGSAGGIGKAIAKKFVEEGACIVLNDNDGERLETAHKEFQNNYNKDLIQSRVFANPPNRLSH